MGTAISIVLMAARWIGHAFGAGFDWIIKVVPAKAWNYVAVFLFATVVGWQAAYVFHGVPALKADRAPLLAVSAELKAYKDSIAEGARVAAEQRAQQEAAAWRAGFNAAASFQNTVNLISPTISQVPYVVSKDADAACVVPWGFVRLWDSYATGASLDAVRARVAPGEPDDARSDVPLSEIASLLGTAAIRFHQNADQLNRLEGFERDAAH